MKILILLVCSILIGSDIRAHPGIGIVKDTKGNIYYTDLKQVWKISQDGSKKVVVSGVHTHELYIDSNDNLYGEHLWYNGEAANTWGHYAWCLKNNGVLVKEIEPTEGFLTNYSYVRDAKGNMYWVERFTTSRIMKKDINGVITKLIEGKFGFIGWLFSTKNGVVYFTEHDKLHRILPGGKLETIAEHIGSRSTDFTMMGRNYDSYGIWADRADNIYISMIDSKRVIRIGPTGNPETILTSGVWTICSGIFDNDGDLWVLEYSATNEVRAREISSQVLAGGTDTARAGTNPHLMVTIFTVVAITILVLIIKFIFNRKNRQYHFAI